MTSFRVIGYEIKTPDGSFLNSCGFWVFANNANEAIEKSKSYGVEKSFYEIIEVIEKDATA